MWYICLCILILILDYLCLAVIYQLLIFKSTELFWANLKMDNQIL